MSNFMEKEVHWRKQISGCRTGLQNSEVTDNRRHPVVNVNGPFDNTCILKSAR